ncbi:hypothetical protein BC567DRAFT_25190 [Phyllosticta citribraziliensis]
MLAIFVCQMSASPHICICTSIAHIHRNPFITKLQSPLPWPRSYHDTTSISTIVFRQNTADFKTPGPGLIALALSFVFFLSVTPTATACPPHLPTDQLRATALPPSRGAALHDAGCRQLSGGNAPRKWAFARFWAWPCFCFPMRSSDAEGVLSSAAWLLTCLCNIALAGKDRQM